jgi:hypothetical protein
MSVPSVFLFNTSQLQPLRALRLTEGTLFSFFWKRPRLTP